LDLFYKRWSKISKSADGDFAEINALHWFNYLAFDIIGDLAFGSPFGMLEKGEDVTECQLSADAETTYVSAIEVINRRGEVSA
jgi:benzoate 4-monooxygenase